MHHASCITHAPARTCPSAPPPHATCIMHASVPPSGLPGPRQKLHSPKSLSAKLGPIAARPRCRKTTAVKGFLLQSFFRVYRLFFNRVYYSFLQLFTPSFKGITTFTRIRQVQLPHLGQHGRSTASGCFGNSQLRIRQRPLCVLAQMFVWNLDVMRGMCKVSKQHLQVLNNVISYHIISYESIYCTIIQSSSVHHSATPTNSEALPASSEPAIGCRAPQCRASYNIRWLPNRPCAAL